MELAQIPLIYSRVRDFGLLYLTLGEETAIFNLFTGEGREQAKLLIRRGCEQLKPNLWAAF